MFENETLELSEVVTEPDLVELERANPTLSGEIALFGASRASPEPSEALGSVEPSPSKKRIKRTEKEMIQALGGSALKEANYIADRIAKLEDKISELMAAVGQPARELILKDNPHLARY